jgi:phospholipase C
MGLLFLLILSNLCTALASSTSAATIEHVVLLVMENRPFDFFFGFADLPGSNGLTGKECNNFTSLDGTTTTKSCVEKGTATYVCRDPAAMDRSVYGKDIWGNANWNSHLCEVSAYHSCAPARDKSVDDCVTCVAAQELGECTQKDVAAFCNKDKTIVPAATPDPTTAQWSSGYLQTNNNNTEVMRQMEPKQIPIKYTLAQEFAVFDDWHASFPGPSTPNHLFLQTATSAGCTETGETNMHNKQGFFTQKTIYESLEASNKTWHYY